MQKTPTLRPGQQRPRLSELLRRRSQTLSEYAREALLHTDDAVQMHCLMHGIDKDIDLPKPANVVAPVKQAEETQEKLEKPTKKSELKNALKDLAKQEVKKMGPAEGE
jgi:ADP-ribosylglycohydrolase